MTVMSIGCIKFVADWLAFHLIEHLVRFSFAAKVDDAVVTDGLLEDGLD